MDKFKGVTSSASAFNSDSHAWPLFEGALAMVVFLEVPKTVYSGNEAASLGEAPVHIESLSKLTGLEGLNRLGDHRTSFKHDNKPSTRRQRYPLSRS